MAKELTWEDAVQAVLASADGALHYVEIADRIVSQGLRSKVGATPAKTVASSISQSMRDEGSPFQRVSKGEYTLIAKLQNDAAPSAQAQVAEAEASEAGALQAFGMFWRRELVVWTGKQSLLGRQGLGATEVNFSDQVGVYLLHDRERVIYVGRASDSLFSRLRAIRLIVLVVAGTVSRGSVCAASIPMEPCRTYRQIGRRRLSSKLWKPC